MLRELLYAEKGQTLIFARTKRGAERLAKNLVRDGFAAAMIHGDRSQASVPARSTASTKAVSKCWLQPTWLHAAST